HAERHVLRVGRARRVVIATDPADAAGDEVGIARVLALHENAVAAEDGGGAVTLGHLTVREVTFREDAQAPDDARDRITVHPHQLTTPAARISARCDNSVHVVLAQKAVGRYPVVRSARGCRQRGSLFTVALVNDRSVAIARP